MSHLKREGEQTVDIQWQLNPSFAVAGIIAAVFTWLCQCIHTCISVSYAIADITLFVDLGINHLKCVTIVRTT